jgi:hypothetical protein
MYYQDKLPFIPPASALPLSKERQALLNAAQYIRDNGWCQHKLELPSGEVCAYGAMSRATYGKEAHTLSEAVGLFSKYCVSAGLIQPNGSFPTWNDTPGRTKEEVIEALEKAAYHGI